MRRYVIEYRDPDGDMGPDAGVWACHALDHEDALDRFYAWYETWYQGTDTEGRVTAVTRKEVRT